MQCVVENKNMLKYKVMFRNGKNSFIKNNIKLKTKELCKKNARKGSKARRPS